MPQQEYWFNLKFAKVKDRVAIIYRDRRYSYGELLEKIEEFKKLIQSEISSGEIVALVIRLFLSFYCHCFSHFFRTGTALFRL